MAKTYREAIDEVSKRPCTCIPCDLCRGTGNIRVNPFTGLPQDGLDDMYDLEACEECHGGIIDVCDRCRELEELCQLEEEFASEPAPVGKP